MSPDPLIVRIRRRERTEAEAYADASLAHTQRKLEQQQSKYAHNANRDRITWFRTARSVIARLLRETGVPCECDDSPHTEKTKYCLRVASGHFVQVRFIANRANYRKLLEEVWSFEQRPHHYYVATTSKDTLRTLAILGYATRTEMGRYAPVSHGHGRPSYYVYLSDLHPFDDLIARLQSALEKGAAQGAVTGAVGGNQ